MAEYKRNDRKPKESARTAPTRLPTLEITAAQCKVCQSEHRRYIEMNLALGMSRKTLARFLSDMGLDISRASLYRHYSNHSSTVDAAMRNIWEKRAKEVFHHIEEVEGYLTTHEGLLEVMLEKFKESMFSNEIVWTAKDALGVIDKLERYQSTKGEMKVEVVLNQARTFGQAVRNMISDDDIHRAILAEYDRLIALQTVPISPEDVVYVGEDDVKELPPGDEDGDA